jgi:bifunctional dethiobiotin synthetase / adenosylmethionine---8-amino-7-oxononanoate aminotransferase
MPTTSKSCCHTKWVEVDSRSNRHVKRYAGPRKDLVNSRCLFRFDEPVSPYLALSMAVEKKGAQVSPRAQFCMLSAEIDFSECCCTR